MPSLPTSDDSEPSNGYVRVGRRVLPQLRSATIDDAERVALLHADSWRRHYRGAFSDAFLDGDIAADRRSVWSARLAGPAGSATILAELADRLVGFVHVIFDDD